MAQTKNGPVYLSKTLFLKGLQCHKAIYLSKFHSELRDELSESQEAIFQSGIGVGILAQGLFPGGREIPYEGLSKESQLQLTEEKIAEGIRTLYEATLRYNDILVKADIINKGRKGWDLYEVKGSAGIKDIYLEDIALQYYVLKKSGLPVNNAFIVYVNNQYVRKGELDLAQSMKGSFSQKKVLPALVPELSYEEMEIGDGGMAMLGFFKMCQSQDPDEAAGLRKALLDYCRLDTLGMVRLFEKLWVNIRRRIEPC